ncbi:hypothetical protein TNCV_3666171 [Trichonephila clavipes]|uniref:Uncharacterized protein n=1 Tax=Trichonephila clavipes TaxID=2585209 RepID=A0A8X6S0U0_TRICX|nr:hypothetical protein TNCV_3666171 [Trichonephila clavipes]
MLEGSVNSNRDTAFVADGYVFPFDMSGEKGLVGPLMAPAPKEAAEGDSESIGEAEGRAQGGIYMPDSKLLRGNVLLFSFEKKKLCLCNFAAKIVNFLKEKKYK